MSTWISRSIAVVVLGLLFAAGTSTFDRQKLRWLNTTPADQVVAHQRLVFGHSYAFQAFSMILMLAFMVAAVEAVSWCLRKITGGERRNRAVHTASP